MISNTKYVLKLVKPWFKSNDINVVKVGTDTSYTLRGIDMSTDQKVIDLVIVILDFNIRYTIRLPDWSVIDEGIAVIGSLQSILSFEEKVRMSIEQARGLICY